MVPVDVKWHLAPSLNTRSGYAVRSNFSSVEHIAHMGIIDR